MNRRITIAAALSAGLAVPALLAAQQPVEPPQYRAEKCYGIAKAGQNDCAATGSDSCGGTSRINAAVVVGAILVAINHGAALAQWVVRF